MVVSDEIGVYYMLRWLERLVNHKQVVVRHPLPSRDIIVEEYLQLSET